MSTIQINPDDLNAASSLNEQRKNALHLLDALNDMVLVDNAALSERLVAELRVSLDMLNRSDVEYDRGRALEAMKRVVEHDGYLQAVRDVTIKHLEERISDMTQALRDYGVRI